ncbi:unnamed protein product, partial [Effrenium voratum]
DTAERDLAAAMEDTAERDLAAAMEDPDLSQGDYYGLCARLPLHCWACEWISPKPKVLQNCCLIPTIGGMGLIGRHLNDLGAEVIVSIGSGAGLVEWLLSARFQVICVDYFYGLSAEGMVLHPPAPDFP